MPDDRFVTHDEPVWRSRANFIIQVDLQAHGMSPGSYEQLWARTDDEKSFAVCCLPFFTYGIALGDTVAWADTDRNASVTDRSGRRLIRCAFTDRDDAAAYHEEFHGLLAATGALVEFHGPGYLALDIDSNDRSHDVRAILEPLQESGRARWEWAGP